MNSSWSLQDSGCVLPELMLALALLFRVGLAGPPLLDVRGGDGPQGGRKAAPGRLVKLVLLTRLSMNPKYKES